MSAASGPFVAIAQAGDTLDLVVWRQLGAGSPTVEQVLAANPGLADLGPVLPEGTTVSFPAIDATPPSVDVVQLWD